MFRSRRYLSRWAARVVLLWLFGVGAGIAHACLASTMAPAALTPGASQHAAQAPQRTLGGCESPASEKTNCQDFCDKAATSIPPLKLALDHAHASALAPPADVTFFVAPAPLPDRQWIARRDDGLAPPVRITLLRLAL